MGDTKKGVNKEAIKAGKKIKEKQLNEGKTVKK
jgi:hypothetical protein